MKKINNCDSIILHKGYYMRMEESYPERYIEFSGTKIKDGGYIVGQGCVCKDGRCYILHYKDANKSPLEIEVDPLSVTATTLEFDHYDEEYRIPVYTKFTKYSLFWKGDKEQGGN